MHTSALITESSFSEGSILVNPSLFFADMPAMIKTMKQSSAWIEGDLNAVVLMRRPEIQIVLTALHEGTEIDSFQSDESITIRIIVGAMHFNTSKESVLLQKGQQMTLNEKVKYSLTTTEGTVFLLTITSQKPGQSGN